VWNKSRGTEGSPPSLEFPTHPRRSPASPVLRETLSAERRGSGASGVGSPRLWRRSSARSVARGLPYFAEAYLVLPSPRPLAARVFHERQAWQHVAFGALLRRKSPTQSVPRGTDLPGGPKIISFGRLGRFTKGLPSGLRPLDSRTLTGSRPGHTPRLRKLDGTRRPLHLEQVRRRHGRRECPNSPLRVRGDRVFHMKQSCRHVACREASQRGVQWEVFHVEHFLGETRISALPPGQIESLDRLAIPRSHEEHTPQGIWHADWLAPLPTLIL
jgi:hypothetical protein